MLQVAELQPGETLVDIGSGDGRVVIEAAVKCPGLKMARGVELDEALVRLARRRIDERAMQEEQRRREGPELDVEEKSNEATALRQRVEIVHADFMQVDVSDADVVVLFFLPHEEVARVLQQKLRPGTRVVTYVFQLKQWEPEKVVSTVPFMTEKGSSSIYLYRVPCS
jgi:precorrin-6B methylase 2